MQLTKTFYIVALSLAATLSSVTLSAETIDAHEFVEAASARGLANIETSKMALKKATSSSVKKWSFTFVNSLFLPRLNLVAT